MNCAVQGLHYYPLMQFLKCPLRGRPLSATYSDSCSNVAKCRTSPTCPSVYIRCSWVHVREIRQQIGPRCCVANCQILWIEFKKFLRWNVWVDAKRDGEKTIHSLLFLRVFILMFQLNCNGMNEKCDKLALSSSFYNYIESRKASGKRASEINFEPLAAVLFKILFLRKNV
jgi:hypothetical protein